MTIGSTCMKVKFYNIKKLHENRHTRFFDKCHFYLLMILKQDHIQRAKFNKINKKMNNNKKV